MAAMTSEVSVDLKTVMLVLKMPRLLTFRMWLTSLILRLAGFVSPVTITAE
jgi:hypothetical protein